MIELSPGLMKRLVAVLVLIVSSPSGAHAETYPDRPVKLLSIHPVGITTDLLARALGQRLGDELGKPIVVENRPGANGIIATNAVAKSTPDGYTMLITSGSHVANALLKETLPYETLKDFAPITAISASYGLVLITNLPVKSLDELIQIGKKRPLSYATNGVGNTTHVAGMLFEKAAKIEMNAVAYSTNSMITDVISGNVDMMFVGTVNADPLVRAGQVRAIATTGASRSKLMADLPTFQELGFKDFDVSGYFGLLFPAGTPKERLEKMQSAVAKVLVTPEMKSFLDISDYYAVGSKPDEFRAFLEADYKQQEKMLKELGLSKR
jgi:tripartite-type tricarboxylate transporter receptor subunit TctC